MYKLLLPIIIVFAFNACKERSGPQPVTSKFTGEIFSGNESESYVEERAQVASVQQTTKAKPEPQVNQNEYSVVKEVPILEDDLPTLPSPEESVTPMTQVKNTSGGTITDGLNIGDIRVSENTERTRIVFDSYSSQYEKALHSGHYTFNYLPELKRIELVVSGYRQFSALGKSKVRHFPETSIIKKIYLSPRYDDSSFQCNIDLKENMKVNVFELTEPGRIVIDIQP